MKPSFSPPAAARAMLRLLSNPEDRDFLLEDLAVRYRDLARTEGLRAARRWYWKQALSAVPWAFRHTWTLQPGGAPFRWQRWAGVVGDLRLGLRTFWRSPLYAVGVAGTLGLGLAAATITFAVAWKVWLAPMPYPDPDRVVRLYELEPLDSSITAAAVGAESRRQLLSAPLLKGFRTHSWHTIEAVSAVLTGLRGEWTRDGDTQDVSRVAVSPEFFGILGIVPTLGRLPADLEAEAEVLLTERFWRTDLGADADVVGSEMILGGRALLVVGIAGCPPGIPDAPTSSPSSSGMEMSPGTCDSSKQLRGSGRDTRRLKQGPK